jgi:hypothetical protein
MRAARNAETTVWASPVCTAAEQLKADNNGSRRNGTVDVLAPAGTGVSVEVGTEAVGSDVIVDATLEGFPECSQAGTMAMIIRAADHLTSFGPTVPRSTPAR